MGLKMNEVCNITLKQLIPFLETSDLLPTTAQALGNIELLGFKKLAFFCSVRCPGSLIIQTYDFFQAFNDEQIAIISGFHSPIEKECLNILLRHQQHIIICPARGLQKMRVRSEYRPALERGRLLFLSPFAETKKRPTTRSSSTRNRFVAMLADSLLLAYAAPASKTEQLCQEVITWHKPVYTFKNDANQNLVAIGATFIEGSMLKNEIKI